MLCDMATSKWAIYLVNDAWHRTTGISQEMAAGGHFWDLFEPPAPAQVKEPLQVVACTCSDRYVSWMRACDGCRGALLGPVPAPAQVQL
jgi:hypothetical protein